MKQQLAFALLAAACASAAFATEGRRPSPPPGAEVSAPNRVSFDRLPRGVPFQYLASLANNGNQQQIAAPVWADAAGKVVARVTGYQQGVMMHGGETTAVTFNDLVFDPTTGKRMAGMSWATRGMSVYYSGPSCTGTPYIFMESWGAIKVMQVVKEAGRTMGLIARADQSGQITAVSYYSPYQQKCFDATQPVTAYNFAPVVESVDLSTFATPPFVWK